MLISEEVAANQGFARRAGVPEGIRTPDLRFRKPLLYPAELPGVSMGRLRTPLPQAPDMATEKVAKSP